MNSESFYYATVMWHALMSVGKDFEAIIIKMLSLM